jgi:NADPH-dependent glutamate synthase beta subunit-like oxidoreductase/Pyruvate/2-oxoacid:ferredoxin oxidoreductase delta subunit
MSPSYLTDAQLRAELLRCQSCETKPCRRGCPAGCSPADFIMAARCGEPSDYRRAAAHILAHNPLGGVCGSVCPDTLCMARCTRRSFDAPVNIPAVQAGIVGKARQLGVLPRFEPLPATGERVAVVGAGPAGLGAASVLAKAGHTVHVFDAARKAGGMVRLIPRNRLDPEVLEADVAWLLGAGDVQLVLGERVELPRDLLSRGFAAVIVAVGLGEPVPLDVPGAERAVHWTRVLGGDPPELRGRRVAVVGDGAVAVDCAEAAIAQRAAHVELFARKALSELASTRQERERLLAAGAHVSCRVRVTAIRGDGSEVTGLDLCKVELAPGQAFHPSRLEDLPHGKHDRRDLDVVILAIGGEPGLRCERHPRVIYAGDLDSGPTSVVEALASGKRAGLEVHQMLAGVEEAACPDRGSCPDGIGCPKRAACPEWNRQTTKDGASGSSRARAGLPVPLTTDFFGRPITSPFLLSAAPAGHGYVRVKRAYEAGWAGGVLSAPGDALDRACADLEQLGQEFPDHLTLASASGPVIGDPEADARSWQAITRRLEAAGAMGIEYALSPAQGNAGSHDPETWARLIDWVLAVSDPGVPKLFRLTAAATTDPLLARIAAAFAHHPDKLAGVTLAGAPPALAFAPRAAAAWDEVAVASAARRGLLVSSDGAPMDYRTAAHRLALGARTVQVGAAAMMYGLGVVNELQSGLSFFLAERGLRSVSELVASAAAQTIPPTGKAVCEVDLATCTGCGNCSRCPHLAIALDARGMPTVDRERCVGCALCVQLCLGGSLSLHRPACEEPRDQLSEGGTLPRR